MSLEEHRVLYSLDRPFRILKWTVPEVLCFFVPSVIGLFCDGFFWGIICGVSLHCGYAKLSKRLGLMSRWMYWTLGFPKLTHFPPSWIRVIGR